MTTATDLNIDGCNTMKVFKRTEVYLSGKFKYVPDPSFIVTKRDRPIGSEARSKITSYQIRNYLP